MRQSWWIVLWVVASLLWTAMVIGGLFVVPRALSRPAVPVVYSPAAHPKTTWSAPPAVEEDETDESAPRLPAVTRSVPVFDARLLDGCSRADLDKIETGITGAIGVGAPLYNEGDFAGCYETYASAARTLESGVGKTCKGPASALKAGRERAATRSTPAESAWAMRDEFDGLLDVIDRKGTEL